MGRKIVREKIELFVLICLWNLVCNSFKDSVMERFLLSLFFLPKWRKNGVSLRIKVNTLIIKTILIL